MSAARAQIRLPITVPPLPLPSVTQAIGDTTARTVDTLADVRRQAMTRLLRDDRRVLEADPEGNPIVRGEILALGISDSALLAARARGYEIDRESAAVGLRVVVLKTPAGLATKKALRDLRDADRSGLYDFNHIYLSVGEDSPAGADESAPPVPAPGASRIRVGLLDSGVDATHPAFRDSSIHPWGCAGRRIAAEHGTEVASLLAERAAADIFAADVYCGSPTGGSVDALAAALGWLSDSQVPVINVSLVGPKNALLERLIAALIARGHLIVAAVGNDGPAAPPLYPAAYPDVIGVTGVDAHRHALIEAGRGPQVMFAARGADMSAAGLDHRTVPVRGTSFAAPAVAALLASSLPTPDRAGATAAVEALARRAIHLGSPGRDLTYGFGLVGVENN
jgi:subtilisin family serine protease